jgi:hypothetical protein
MDEEPVAFNIEQHPIGTGKKSTTRMGFRVAGTRIGRKRIRQALQRQPMGIISRQLTAP